MKFLRNFFASFLALVAFSILMFVIFIVVLSAMSDSEKFNVKQNSVLKISLTQPLADRDFDDPLSKFSLSGNENRIGIVDLKKALNQAANDEKIKGVVLYAHSLMGGFALGQEARRVLADFKDSGKFIWAYAELMTEGGYYISSVADKVYLSPEGMIEWNGLSVEINFFKGTFDKLEIKPQIFRVGDYKSAVEPYLLDKMSDDNREQMKSLLNSLYGNIVAEVAGDLDIDADQLLALSNNMSVQSAQDAVDHKLITDLLYKDEFESLLAE